MTAAEIYELVKGWPRKAWPTYPIPGVTLVFRPAIQADLNDEESEGVSARWRWMGPGRDGSIMVIDCENNAALLFEASGMRWLIGQGWHVGIKSIGMVRVTVCGPNPMPIEYGPIGGEPLHAISAAIAALAALAPGEKA